MEPLHYTTARRTRGYSRVLALYVAAGMLMLSQVSCYRHAKYRRIDNDPTIPAASVFDRYLLSVYGVAVTDTSVECRFHCYVKFLNTVPDTVKWDSIPVLIIDSACLRGSCFASATCAIALSDAALYNRDNPTSSWRTIGDRWPEDLNSNGRELVVMGFEFDPLSILPSSCLGEVGSATLYCRLIDRKSKRLLDTSSITLPLRAIIKSRALYG